MAETEKLTWDQTQEHIRTTGEWWINPWWLKTTFMEVIPRSEAQIENAFEYLKKIFPASWAKGFPGDLLENHFLRSILYPTAFQRAHLIRLSERLQRLTGVPGLHAVIKALHGKRESDAADMELEFGDFFFQKGLEIEFPTPKSSKGKTPDIRIISNNHRFAVECKQLKVAKITAFTQSVYTEANFKLNEMAHARGLGWRFCFFDDTMANVWNLYSQGYDYTELINGWGKRIGDQLDLAVKNGHWPVWIFMEGLGEGIFHPSDGAGSTTRFPNTPDELLFRRLMTNALIPAAEQLANEPLPGLIAISVRDLPTDEYLSREINRFFGENTEKYGNVVAVLVVPWQPWFYEDPPRLVFNRSATVGWSDGIDSVIQKLDATMI